ncbi:MAG: glycoside hydrolase [Flavobacteriaceae bacterium]|nr:glycoside hydrolase [Flavobacteriaceae bacterium]
MKKFFLIALLPLFLASCGSSKTVHSDATRSLPDKGTTRVSSATAENIVNYAMTFEGTKYKFGGTSKKGMDCSGLIYTAFNKEKVWLPRISRDMAREGKSIPLRQTDVGDLLFFQTNKSSRVINHVGLVVESLGGAIKFIHSTTSRGVIISSLDERYWNDAFVEVRRMM